MNTTIADLVLNGTSTRQVATVQETRDYARFSLMELNRDVNRQHVERLKQSFERDYLLAPILVNENFEIVDGQHRFTAAKEMGLPIRYVVANGYTIEHVKMLNHEGKNWSVMDHFMSYVKQGVPAYVNTAKLFGKFDGLTDNSIASIVYKFSERQTKIAESRYKKSSLSPSAALQTSLQSGGYSDAVKSGAFADSGLFKAESFLHWLLARAKAFSAIKGGSYISALISFELFNESYDRNRMAQSIDNYHYIMSPAVNKALAERQLEEAYNYKRQNRVRLARV